MDGLVAERYLNSNFWDGLFPHFIFHHHSHRPLCQLESDSLPVLVQLSPRALDPLPAQSDPLIGSICMDRFISSGHLSFDIVVLALHCQKEPTGLFFKSSNLNSTTCITLSLVIRSVMLLRTF